MSDFYVVVGLGITGLSCAKYLHRLKQPFAVMDTRENPPQLALLREQFPDVPLKMGGLDEHLLNQATHIILSPGIALRTPAIAAQIKKGKQVWGDIELFAQAVKVPVVAITGTNAKSTVTTLVGQMAQAAGYQVETGGNLGVPALDLLEHNPKANLFVLELSSFQLETTYSLKANVATVLNISPDHMDRYVDLEDYKNAKHHVYRQAEKAVENRDDPLTFCHEPNIQKKIRFTMQTPLSGEFGLLRDAGQLFLALGEAKLIAAHELLISGKHSQANALAALAIGYALGLPIPIMLTVLRTFKGLPHRCQLVREREHIRWINDSKGTNVGATLAAICGLGSETTGKLVLIAGGVGKNADFTMLVPAIQQYARQVILIGDAAKALAKAIGEAVPITFANDMHDAVKQAALAAKPKDSVLLSPACASFDMFKNFEHRGEVFTEIVNRLT